MFADDLREQLKANHMTQKDLAEYCDVNQPAVSGWVTGKCQPPERCFDLIVELFELKREHYTEERAKYHVRKEEIKRKQRGGNRTDNSCYKDFDRMKLIEIRERSGISQHYLANMVGVSKDTIINWERGKHKPTLSVLEKVNDFFHVTMDYWKKTNKTSFIPKEEVDAKIKDKVNLSENPYHKAQKPLESFKTKTTDKLMPMEIKHEIKTENPKSEKLEFDKEPYRCDMEIKKLKEKIELQEESLLELASYIGSLCERLDKDFKKKDDQISDLQQKVVYMRGLIDGAYTDKLELESKSWWSRLWA